MSIGKSTIMTDAFLGPLLVPSGNFEAVALHYATTTTFRIFSNSLLIKYFVFKLFVVWATHCR
jgi:hypothetical protein